MLNHEPTLALYVLSTFVTFITAFTKTFQQRNIIQGRKKAAFFTSWVVSSLEVSSIGVVILGGWYVLISAGIGGSLGTIIAMHYHSKLFKG